MFLMTFEGHKVIINIDMFHVHMFLKKDRVFINESLLLLVDLYRPAVQLPLHLMIAP